MANEKRLIDVDILLAHLDRCIEQGKGLFKSVCVAIKCFVEQMPTVDAVEVVHSFWDDSGRYVFPSGRKAVCCDICKCALGVGEYNRFKWNYCPVCGAKMDGGKDDVF